MTTALELPEAQVHANNIKRSHRTGGTRARTIIEVQTVQGPWVGTTGGEEQSALRHLCEWRLLTEGHCEAERIIAQNYEGPGRGEDRVFDIWQTGGKGATRCRKPGLDN